MKDKDEIVSMSSRTHDEDIPDNLTEPPSLIDSDALDHIFKKAKEGEPPDIITAIYKRLTGLFRHK